MLRSDPVSAAPSPNLGGCSETTPFIQEAKRHAKKWRRESATRDPRAAHESGNETITPPKRLNGMRKGDGEDPDTREAFIAEQRRWRDGPTTQAAERDAHWR